MLIQIFKAILITSCIGGLVSIILFLLKPLTKRFFSPAWNYYIWLAVLVVMIIPVRLPVPEKGLNDTLNLTDKKYAQTQGSANEYPAELPNISPLQTTPDVDLKVPEFDVKEKASPYDRVINYLTDNLDLISFIWIMIALVSFLFKLTQYILFVLKIRKNSEKAKCEEIRNYTKRKVAVKICDTISSPMIVGVFNPTLILPATELTSEQMKNVLCHEITHLKRNDILYKWFATIVKCIHWFNPTIYFAVKTINKECEISCDYAVVKNMNKEQEKEYVNTILALISTKKNRLNTLTTEMSGKKKSLKERFAIIKNRRKLSKKAIIISLVIGVFLLGGALMISGVLNGLFFREKSEETEIKLTNNGEIIIFDNKPFMHGEMAYFPLEELVAKLNSENRVEKTGEKYVVYLTEDVENYTVSADLKEIIYSGQGGAFRETEYSPILKDNIIYIPYEYVRYIFVDANNYYIGGSFLYKNEKMNIKFEIPLGWCGKYIIDESTENEYVIVFKHKATVEKYPNAGTLFSVYRIEDANVDEAMRVYGNMTVVWRNAEFAYVVARPTDVQHPIWVDRDEEDIDIAIEYESLYAGINYIQETFKLIDESKEKSIPVIENAENLSYAQMKDLQRMVDEGHFPWRLDYEQVIMMWVSAQGEEVIGGRIVAFSGGGQDCSATYIVNGNTYIVELFKPIRNDDTGIWIVRSCEKQIPSVVHEIFFYERNPGQAWIFRGDDGWWRMIPRTMAVFPGEALGVGVLPKSIVAYFTDAGTNMEQYQREVGRTDGPFAQIPITLELNFSENDTLGHLHFVYYYEDGTTKTSQYYNVLVE